MIPLICGIAGQPRGRAPWARVVHTGRAQARGAPVWPPRPTPPCSAVLVFAPHTFDKWLYFYILIGNRKNTSDAQEKPQVPAQAGDERVSNERQRLLQGKKMRDASSGGGPVVQPGESLFLKVWE